MSVQEVEQLSPQAEQLVLPERIYRRIMDHADLTQEESAAIGRLDFSERPWGRGSRVYVSGARSDTETLARVLRSNSEVLETSVLRSILKRSLVGFPPAHSERSHRLSKVISSPTREIVVGHNEVTIPFENGQVKLVFTSEGC